MALFFRLLGLHQTLGLHEVRAIRVSAAKRVMSSSASTNRCLRFSMSLLLLFNQSINQSINHFYYQAAWPIENETYIHTQANTRKHKHIKGSKRKEN